LVVVVVVVVGGGGEGGGCELLCALDIFFNNCALLNDAD